MELRNGSFSVVIRRLIVAGSGKSQQCLMSRMEIINKLFRCTAVANRTRFFVRFLDCGKL